MHGSFTSGGATTLGGGDDFERLGTASNGLPLIPCFPLID
jgi:hypothetical protein